MGGQFGIAQLLAGTVFTDSHQGRVVIAAAQQVFGKVQCCTGKPVGAGHGIAFLQHCLGLGAKADFKELDNPLPEGLTLRHAPGVQGRIVGQLQAVALIDEAAEAVHPSGGDTFGRRRPQWLLHRASSSFLLCRRG